MDDKKSQEFRVKCETMKDDPGLMKECRIMLDTMVEKKFEPEEDPKQSYVNMAENISANDVPKVLEMAFKIAKSGKIEDPEIKIAAERLIRTLEHMFKKKRKERVCGFKISFFLIFLYQNLLFQLQPLHLLEQDL